MPYHLLATVLVLKESEGQNGDELVGFSSTDLRVKVRDIKITEKRVSIKDRSETPIVRLFKGISGSLCLAYNFNLV